jgi:hypothetical protein
MNASSGARRRWWTPILAPRGLALRAVGVLLVFTILHLAGLRDYSCILCGTPPTGDPHAILPLLLGTIYVLFYIGAVLVAPVVLLTAVVQYVLLLLWPGEGRRDSASVTSAR